MAAISITAANVAIVSGATVNKNYNYGATITAGLCVYLDSSDNELKIADNGAATTDDVFGIALNGGSDGQPAVVFTGGDITIGGTVAIGKVYMLGTSGAIIPIDDAVAAGTVYATFIGIGISATVIRCSFLTSGVEFADDVT